MECSLVSGWECRAAEQSGNMGMDMRGRGFKGVSVCQHRWEQVAIILQAKRKKP